MIDQNWYKEDGLDFDSFPRITFRWCFLGSSKFYVFYQMCFASIKK